MAQLVPQTVSRCVVGSIPRGAEHFGFPPSPPRLGVYSRFYALVCTAKREGGCLPVVGSLLVSFIK